ncbi:ATP-binding protein [Jatrophihabitans sp.]|uniref:ATP-binding protein n=1 Tax=Jatrophihabitans sp. TaxID=1932789 RepID=UPI002BAEDEA5|nr:ATP-binding protein [Jatrophihabitans sp.]
MTTLWLRHTPSSAALARRSVLVAFGAAGVAGEPAHDAALIVSELVGNAVRHAAPLPSGQLAVRWVVDRDGYSVSVTDGGSSTPATGRRIAARSAGAQDPSGRGLRIVAALADTWGVAAEDGATTVWARTRMPQAS